MLHLHRFFPCVLLDAILLTILEFLCKPCRILVELVGIGPAVVFKGAACIDGDVPDL